MTKEKKQTKKKKKKLPPKKKKKTEEDKEEDKEKEDHLYHRRIKRIEIIFSLENSRHIKKKKRNLKTEDERDKIES